MKRGLLVLALLGLIATPAMADLATTAVASAPGTLPGGVRDSVIDTNPYDGIQTYGSAAQDFESAFDVYDISVFVDFTAANDYYLSAYSSQGFPTAAADGISSTGKVWDDLPWNGGSIVATGTGTDTLYTTGSIQGTFAGELLTAGTYWLELQARRDYTTSGQSFLYRTEPSPYGAVDQHWNPGGGFGFGDHQDLTTDINFEIRGDLVPEPATLVLLAFGSLVMLRRR